MAAPAECDPIGVRCLGTLGAQDFEDGNAPVELLLAHNNNSCSNYCNGWTIL